MSLAEQSQHWFPASVQVTVLQARGLRIKGKNGTNDAYAVMQVAKEKYSTSVAEKSVAPVWKEEATFDMPPLHHHGNAERSGLRVHVMHRALVGPDKLLGQAAVSLPELQQDKARSKTEWFKLLDKAGKADKDRGEVLLDIQFTRNNITASMFDLSAADKPRSRLRKFKDKVRGKKEEGLSDAASAVVPSFTQVLTDSEEEGEGDVYGDGAADKEEKKKKHKLKSLFSHKSNLQKTMSQSMSLLPEKNSSLSGSQSSGLNAESSEGKKKFKFMLHKSSGSSDTKGSQRPLSIHEHPKTAAEQSNLCINGSHVYTEEAKPRSSRTGSNFSLASSGHGSMEDLQRSVTSTESHRTLKQNSPWTEDEGSSRQQEEQERVEEEEIRREELERIRMEKERVEEERKRRLEQEERVRKEEEEERERVAEEKRLEEEERRRIEEERKRRQEEERVRKEEEEKERLAEEKRQEEEERRRLEEEDRRLEEEERRRVEKEERRKLEEEERMRLEQDERRKLEEEERRRIEEDSKRRQEEERVRNEEERERLAEERRLEEEARRRLDEEERRLEEGKKVREEQARIKMEKERVEEERKRRQEQEERVRKEEEEERLAEDKRLEEEDKIRWEKQEMIRVEKERVEKERKRTQEQEERVRKEEEERERLVEEKRRLEEQERRRLEEQEQRVEEERNRRQEEEERVRKEEEQMERLAEEKRLEEQERRRLEEEERRRVEERKRRQEQEERVRKEEEEKERLAVEKRLEEEEKVRREEQEKIKMEKERVEEERKRRQEEEERVRKEEEEERERVAEEKRRLEEGEMLKAEEEKRIESMRREEEKQRKEEERLKVTEEENRLNNPFEEISSSSPPARPLRTAKVSTAKPRYHSAVPLVGSKEEVSLKDTMCADGKDPASAQRDKRPAPQPPERHGTEKPREQNVSALHLAQTNKQSRHKDVKTSQRLVQMIAPLSRSSSTTKNAKVLETQSTTHCNNQPECITSPTAPSRAVKRNKGPAPSRPHSSNVGGNVLTQVSGDGPISEPKRAVSSDAHRKTSNIPGSVTKQAPVVFGSNPFEDDDDDETEIDHITQDEIKSSGSAKSMDPRCPSTNAGLLDVAAGAPQTPDDDGISQTKGKSSKMARAPLPPAKKAATSGALTKEGPGLASKKQDSVIDVAVPDNRASQGDDPQSAAISSVSDQKTLPLVSPLLCENQPGAAQGIGEEAGGKRDGPPSASRRLHPVKPLNPLDHQSVPVIQGTEGNQSLSLLSGIQGKIKVKESGLKGPYSQLTQEELISLVLKQESQLSEKDKKMSELEQYIDNLLVRVIEEKPSILMSLGSLKKDP